MEALLEKTEPRTLLLGLGGVVLLLVLVMVMYLLWPQVQKYREYSRSQEILGQAAPGNAGLALQLEQVRDEVSTLSRKLHGDMAGLPAKQMEAFIIGRLQTISWDNDVRLVSVKPGVGERIQNFQERLFEIQLRARFHDFYRWLNKTGEDLGFIVVKNYRINPRGRLDLDPELDVRLTIVSYHLVKE